MIRRFLIVASVLCIGIVDLVAGSLGIVCAHPKELGSLLVSMTDMQQEEAGGRQ